MPAPIVSSFGSNSDGWTLQGDHTVFEYVGSGGNPGGYVHWVDSASDDVVYYSAPGKFLGDRSAYYDGAISYDVEDTGSDYSDAPDVVLVGSDLSLVIKLGQAGTTWTSYAAALNDTAGWKVGSLDGPAATAGQIQHVLATLEALTIRGAYQSGSEEGGLDNVVMSAAPGPYKLFDSSSENALLGTFDTFGQALAAAHAGNEIAVDDFVDADLGKVTIGIENLTVRAGSSFYANFTLDSPLISFALSGITASTVAGNSKNNFLYGSDGSNVFVGDAGNDRIEGGNGADTVDYSSSTRNLTIDLSAIGPQAINGFGSDTLISIESVLSGTGNDRLTGNADANSLLGKRGNDKLYGLGGRDTLYGDDGADLLDGGEGADTMFGDNGADIYYVDNTGDKVFESGTDGAIDKVYSSVTFTLTGLAENLTLTGTRSISGTGNDLDNTIVGNNQANVLDGGKGKDQLYGGDGNDKLYGGDNADTLRGGKGNDILMGDAGVDDMDGGGDSDTYYADSTDNVHDSGASGTDRVIAVGSYTGRTGDGIERFETLSTGNVALTGNELNNAIYGGDGKNTLKGLAGRDTLYGGASADILSGGTDRDVLFGRGGADTFVFATGDTGITSTTYDVVKDFVSANGDKIDLDVVASPLSSGAYAERSIASNSYTTAYNAAVSAMSDGDHTAVFVAGSTLGFLFWNTDGDATRPDQAIRLDGVNNVSLFDRTSII